MRTLVWLFRAALFFTLFAFALNNLQESRINWFFGFEWRTSMVFIVLAAFALGCAFGAIAMVPSWWRHRRVARTAVATAAMPLDIAPAAAQTAAHPAASTAAALSERSPPARDGL